VATRRYALKRAVFQTGVYQRSARAPDPRIHRVLDATIDRICGRRLMRVKRYAPISCRHGCLRKEPLLSDQRSRWGVRYRFPPGSES